MKIFRRFENNVCNSKITRNKNLSSINAGAYSNIEDQNINSNTYWYDLLSYTWDDTTITFRPWDPIRKLVSLLTDERNLPLALFSEPIISYRLIFGWLPEMLKSQNLAAIRRRRLSQTECCHEFISRLRVCTTEYYSECKSRPVSAFMYVRPCRIYFRLNQKSVYANEYPSKIESR